MDVEALWRERIEILLKTIFGLLVANFVLTAAIIIVMVIR